MTQPEGIDQLLQALLRARSGYLRETEAHTGQAAYVSNKPGEWSAAQVESHMVEWSEFELACLQRIAEDPDPLIGRVLDNPARLSGVQRHADQPLQETSKMVSATWDQIFALVKGWNEQTWLRSYRHLHRGTDTAVDFLQRAVDHFDGHTNQLERIRAAAGAS